MTVVRAYVGVTDNDWYRFLADRPELTEVNFWQPSGGHEFRVLAPGEPFFFKTHYPHNKVVGGGFFSDSARLRVSEAWELFGEANGADSIEQMRARIGRYRRAPIGGGEDQVIGCLFVRDVRFFPPDAIAEPPPRFAPNIVQGKSYDLADQSVAPYFGVLLQLLLGGAVVELDFSQPWHRPGPVFGDPRLAPYRLGQRSSRRSSWMLTTGGAQSAERTYPRCYRQPTSALSRRAVSTVWTTGCCSGRTSIRCLTADILPLIPGTVCWSAPGCAGTSATAISSTPRPGRSSTCPNTEPTGPAATSSNGTSMKSSRPHRAGQWSAAIQLHWPMTLACPWPESGRITPRNTG